LLDLLFDPEDGGSTFFRNVPELLPDYTVSNPRIHLLRISDPTWRILFFTEYDSGDKIKESEKTRPVTHRSEIRIAQKVLIVKPENKILIGRPRLRWNDTFGSETNDGL
jgi:hypothetical protein